MSGEGILNSSARVMGFGDVPAAEDPRRSNQPRVRVPGYILDELRPFAVRRGISTMRLARVLLHELVAADLVDAVAGDAR